MRTPWGRAWRGSAAVLLVLPCCFVPPVQGQEPDIEGAWRAERYLLGSGPSHPLRGHILFADGDWNVLFFVLDAEGRPRRVSAEGGTYTLDGQDLVFTHLFYAARGEAVEGLPEAPFEMRAPGGPGTEEAARVVVDGRTMTLFFPSGNRMRFRRAP